MANVIINDTNLTNIANAIREKNGLTDTYKPSEMAGAILAITTGGGTGGDFEWPETINIAKEINYNDSFTWLWEQAPRGTKISTSGVTYGFSNNNMVDASHLIIVITGTNTIHYFYADNFDMTALPVTHFIGTCGVNYGYFFEDCNELRNIPEDIFMIKSVNGNVYTSTGALTFPAAYRSHYMFMNCYSLRKHPILHDGTQRTGYQLQSYQYMFSNCYALDEIVDLPVNSQTSSSNMFTSTFGGCGHVNRITFATQADGTPYSATWSNQTIDLTAVGYVTRDTYMTDYNSGLTTATQVKANSSMTDAERLAIMTNHPDDWWTALPSYSRYSHVSAVETINSLPDCSAGSSNTIKFKTSLAVSNPDGRCGDLTEEEIAVAAAKGWTVSLVS